MSKTDARVLFCAMIPDGFNAEHLTERAKTEVRAGIEKILELVAKHEKRRARALAAKPDGGTNE